MKNSIKKLAAMGGHSLSETSREVKSDFFSADELESSGIMTLLRSKNGFYAFEGALHVYASSAVEGEQGLEEWNAVTGWRSEYRGLADGCFFFAEDIFGSQFCLHERSVMCFDPETGEKSLVAADVAGWASRVLKEYDVLTGYPLAHEWQVRHGAVRHGQRLIPKIPFVLGGDFSVDNLFPLEAVRAMRSRANLALQIKELPDGAHVEFKVVD